MQLFLTSSGWKVLPKIVSYLSQSPSNLRVAFIPTAANLYKEQPWVDEDRNKLLELGFIVSNLDLENNTSENIILFLKDKDIIFVAGGNTFYLLEQAQKSGFEEVVKEWVDDNKVYIGSSAGSVIAGPDIESVAVFDDRKEANLRSTRGFNFIDSVILPHYSNKEFKKYNEDVIEKFKNRYKFTLLTDQQFVKVNGKDQEIVEV